MDPMDGRLCPEGQCHHTKRTFRYSTWLQWRPPLQDMIYTRSILTMPIRLPWLLIAAVSSLAVRYAIMGLIVHVVPVPDGPMTALSTSKSSYSR